MSVADGWGYKGIDSNEGSITIFAWDFHGQTDRFIYSDIGTTGYKQVVPYPHVMTSNHFLSVQVNIINLAKKS
jgi:hypothetical protein